MEGPDAKISLPLENAQILALGQVGSGWPRAKRRHFMPWDLELKWPQSRSPSGRRTVVCCRWSRRTQRPEDPKAVRYRNSGRYIAVVTPSETAIAENSGVKRSHTDSGGSRPQFNVQFVIYQVLRPIVNMKTKEDNLSGVQSVVKDGSFVQIKVLFFAKARDITGLTELSMEVSSGSTTQDCLKKLVAKFPNLDEICQCIVLALNEEYTTELAVVKDKDELAIIPPISGG
ncbi:hypothetical protein CXB51_015964 [Gossypium anomalum]|uniref:Molybdopterin synthase sulfur carrier subunit n=1 Tax=Gossypium anomalum TaxID=47600 RepID=A0A8J5YI88_9ROSI|nr:hypothetical protein CXB51_015964 [Gossypium anomalum]